MPNKTTIVLDASVVVKWFHKETDTELATLLLEKILGIDIQALIPALLLYEVANTLTLKADSQINEVVRACRFISNLPIRVVENHNSVVERAIHLAHQYRISVYDATYLALAINYNAILLTADLKLIEAVGTQYVKPLNRLYDFI